MLIFYKMLAVLTLLVFLLRRKTEFGHAMLAATLLLFLLTVPELPVLFEAAQNTVSKPTTWFMLLTLYFVMCLEHILRTSGVLKNFTTSARQIFGSDRVLLAFIPAFLGFLPSLGGAMFSAPLVKESAKRYNLSPERMTAINYWFRHIWEYTNPILPAILLASTLTRVPVGTLIANLFVFSIAAIVIGAVVLLMGKSFRRTAQEDPQDLNLEKNTGQHAHTRSPANEDQQTKEPISAAMIYKSILLAAGPIFVNIFLVMVFNLNTALSLGLVLTAMAIILKLDLFQTKKMFLASMKFSIHWAVINIILFQEMLFSTGTIDQIVALFELSGIPVILIISLTSFIAALLIGSLQGFIAVAFPLIYPLAHSSMDVIIMSYVAGVFGLMCSPSHLCLIVTLQYFKADFVKSLLPIIFMQILMVLFALAYISIFF